MERDEFSRTLEKYEGVFNPFNVKVGDLNSTRVSIDIPQEVHQKLRNATIDRGFFQRALSMFIYCMSDFCDQKQIMFYSPLEQKELYEFIRRRCTLVESAGSGHGEHDNGGVEKPPSRTKSSGRKRAVTKKGNSKKRPKTKRSNKSESPAE